MDWNDPRQLEVFFRLHSGLPREGPGCRESTQRALAETGRLHFPPRVLDVGCGPGKQTLDLASMLPAAQIVAVDLHGPFLVEVARRAAEAGVDGRVFPLCADMARLPFEEGRFDLIWSEGAAYSVGVETALRAWEPLLADGGAIGFTEAVWLKGDPPEVVRAMWEEYPAMTDRAGTRARVEAAGLEVVHEHVLGESAWWDDYYGPLEARIELLRAELGDDPAAKVVLDENAHECAVYREHADCYGYAFFVCRRPSDATE